MDFNSRGRRTGPVTIFDLFSRPLTDFDYADSYADQESSNREGAESFLVDIYDCGSGYILTAEMPGVSKDNLQLDFEDGVLSIKAPHHQQAPDALGHYLLQERVSGLYQRAFAFDDADSSAIEASFENGLLRVVLPKLSCRQHRSSIEIK